MTLGVSLLLVAAGAILIWGVTGEASGIDVDAIGVILIVVGIIGIATDDISTRWGIIVITVGVINLIRAIPHGGD